MDTILLAQLDRVETALNNLVDSITSYNPSIAAAHDLVAADDELGKGLELRMSTSKHGSSRKLINTQLRSISRITIAFCNSARPPKHLTTR